MLYFCSSSHEFDSVRLRSGKMNIAEVGLGLVTVSLEPGWSYNPQPPFSGTFIAPNGRRYMATVNSYEDPAAAAGGDRVLDYLEDDGFEAPGLTATEALGEIIGYGRARKDGRPGRMIWKWLEPFRDTHLREFVLETSMDEKLFDSETETLLSYGADIMLTLKFNRQETPLDRIAPSENWQRLDVGPGFFIRVPAAWTIEFEPGEGESFDQFVVAGPDDSTTMWISYQIINVKDETVDALSFKNVFEFIATETFADESEPFDEMAPEFLAPLDGLVTFTRRNEPEPSGPLRRKFWIRLTSESSISCQSMIHLCIGEDRLADPDYLDMTVPIEQEIRRALVLPLLWRD